MGREEQRSGWPVPVCHSGGCIVWVLRAKEQEVWGPSLASFVQLSTLLFLGTLGVPCLFWSLLSSVSRVCVWSWDGLSLPDATQDSWCCSPRMTPDRGSRELGAQAEQINCRIMSANSWKLAMGSEPVPLTSGCSQCRGKGGGKKIHSACGKRGSKGLTSSFCFLWGKAHGGTDVVWAPVTMFHFSLQNPGAWNCVNTQEHRPGLLLL